MQEIIYLITTQGDFDGFHNTPLDKRFPYLEIAVPGMPIPSGMDLLEKMERPRRFKTHMYSNFFEVSLAKLFILS